MANKCSQCGFEAKDENELREHVKAAHKGASASSGTAGGTEEM